MIPTRASLLFSVFGKRCGRMTISLILKVLIFSQSLFIHGFTIFFSVGIPVRLSTSAPRVSRFRYVGVFAMNENVSSLLQYPFFLPTCINLFREELNLTLSETTTGYIWAEETVVQFFSPTNLDSRLVPFTPQSLQPKLTGTYGCSAHLLNTRTLVTSGGRYILHVVGKEQI